MIDIAELQSDVRDYLNDGKVRTTKEVLAAIAAPDATQGELYKALIRLSEYELADCVTRGEPVARKMMGKLKTVRPYIWQKSDRPVKVRPSKNTITCPHCKGLIEVQ